MATPVGLVPVPGGLDMDGLDVTEADLVAALAIDPAEWEAEIPLIEEWFAHIGDTVPASLHAQLATLKAELGH